MPKQTPWFRQQDHPVLKENDGVLDLIAIVKHLESRGDTQESASSRKRDRPKPRQREIDDLTQVLEGMTNMLHYRHWKNMSTPMEELADPNLMRMFNNIMHLRNLDPAGADSIMSQFSNRRGSTQKSQRGIDAPQQRAQ